MGATVCLFASTLYYPEGGGHLWAYLNWALGLRKLGCRVVWVEGTDSSPYLADAVKRLKCSLAPYGLADDASFFSWAGDSLPPAQLDGCSDLQDVIAGADLLLSMAYTMPSKMVRRFRRSALLDIDPGRLQIWMTDGHIDVAPHDIYFTIGETVGQRRARFPDAGQRWHYTPPCVAIDWWPVSPASADAPFTTVSHWYNDDGWMNDGEDSYPNDKRDGFLPFLDLPKHAAQALELALCLAPHEQGERNELTDRGWRIRDAHVVAPTPWHYQRYVQGSRGEFSCARPSCIRLQNAWVSDRTLCYLASGKPAVVQDTGPSRILPDAAGLFRFRELREAAHCLETVASDYENQSRLARALAEHYFDAESAARNVLERALA